MHTPEVQRQEEKKVVPMTFSTKDDGGHLGASERRKVTLGMIRKADVQ